MSADSGDDDAAAKLASKVRARRAAQDSTKLLTTPARRRVWASKRVLAHVQDSYFQEMDAEPDELFDEQDAAKPDKGKSNDIEALQDGTLASTGSSAARAQTEGKPLKSRQKTRIKDLVRVAQVAWDGKIVDDRAVQLPEGSSNRRARTRVGLGKHMRAATVAPREQPSGGRWWLAVLVAGVLLVVAWLAVRGGTGQGASPAATTPPSTMSTIASSKEDVAPSAEAATSIAEPTGSAAAAPPSSPAASTTASSPKPVRPVGTPKRTSQPKSGPRPKAAPKSKAVPTPTTSPAPKPTFTPFFEKKGDK